MRPFTVKFWTKAFRLLGELTPLRILRTRIIPKINPAFKENVAGNDALIEIWCLGGLVLSIVALMLCLVIGRWSWRIAIIFGWVRVWEIVVIQINVLLFDWYRRHEIEKTGQSQRYALVGYLRTVLMLLQNYAEIIVWFAVLYAGHFIHSSAVAKSGWFDLLNLSFVTMTTFGRVSDGHLENQVGNVLPFLQAAIGLFLSSAVLARFIGLLPEPGTLDEQEQSVRPRSSGK